MIDRRAFLRRLGFGTVAAAAAATGMLDVERLLWAPGEKTIFIPPQPTIAPLGTLLRKGDVFTIEGRFALNPVTRRATGLLEQFIVTSDVSEGELLQAVQIVPRPVVDGCYANVTGEKAGLHIDGKTITTWGWSA